MPGQVFINQEDIRLYVLLAKRCLSHEIRLLLSVVFYTDNVEHYSTSFTLSYELVSKPTSRRPYVPSLHERHFYSLGSDAHPEITEQ